MKLGGHRHAKKPTSLTDKDIDDDYKSDVNLPPIQKNNYFDSETDNHVNDLKSGQSNILVAVRARPLSAKEANISNYETLRFLDGKVVIVMDPQNQFDSNDVFRQNRNKEKQYAFDFAFDDTKPTETVFENTTKFLIPGVLNGFNATVFAYGATGAGKTFTMLGGQNRPGIMFLTMNELFKQTKNQGNKNFAIKLSYMEVYNEQLRDLISPDNGHLELREDNAKGIVVAGVTEVLATSAQEVMEMLTVGNRNRTMEPTGANVVSSRSHAVLQVTVEQKEKHQGINEEHTVSKLSLIDLAGSERASNTNNTGQRMIEGANINRSLLALGNCITLLSDQAGKGLKNTHIPYRDSKLTRLLKDSLGGNCRTVMIANLSPAATCFDETLNTLKYANRAKNIKVQIQRNVLKVENHVEKYAQIISDLKNENEHLKKLLHEQQIPGGMHNFNDISQSSISNSDAKDALVNEIKQHFDDEMRMKKKIFEAETQHDEIEEKVLMMKNEMNIMDDKLAKGRYEEYLATQKKLLLQADKFQKEYGTLSMKRNNLLSKVQKEKNKDTVAYLQSVFKQNQMIIENMDLQHKEKRVEGQVRLKDRQLKYLQEQLAMRKAGEMSATSSQPRNLSIRRNTDQKIDVTDSNSLQNDMHDDDLSLLADLNELKNNNSNPKVFGQAKQALFMPFVNQKVNHVSSSQASRKILPKRFGGRGSPMGEHPFQKNIISHQNQNPFYYKKEQYLQEKQRAFEAATDKRPKKKLRYVPVNMRREVLGSNRSRDASMDDKADQPRTREMPAISPRQHHYKNVKSLTDLSHVSTASSANPSERKKPMIDDIIKKNHLNMPVIPKKNVINHTNMAARYGASPYVRGLRGKTKE